MFQHLYPKLNLNQQVSTTPGMTTMGAQYIKIIDCYIVEQTFSVYLIEITFSVKKYKFNKHLQYIHKKKDKERA